jgi:class 3 adenylate cyclase
MNKKKRFNTQKHIFIGASLTTDVQNSTQIAEQLTPNALTRSLERYFSILSSVLTSFNAVISSYAGDSVTGVFGLRPALTPKDTAYIACCAAVKLLQSIQKFNLFLLTQEVPASCVFVTRIGLEIGEIVGISNPMAEPVLQQILIGKPFNYAQRLSEVARPFNESAIVVGPRTVLTLGERRSKFCFDPLEKQLLRGVSKPIAPYRLLPRKPHWAHATPPFSI